MTDLFAYDNYEEDNAFGKHTNNFLKDMHPVIMDDGTTKYIPNDELEF